MLLYHPLKGGRQKDHIFIVLSVEITNLFPQIPLLRNAVYTLDTKRRLGLLEFCYDLMAKIIKIPVSAKVKGAATKLQCF